MFLCRSEGLKWTWLQKQGAEVNPCNSALHPAVAAGLQPRGDARSVQEAYNPSSQCFGCGARSWQPFTYDTCVDECSVATPP